jgi:hypothetical protein
VEPGQAEISCDLTTSAAATAGSAEAKWSLQGRLYRESPLHSKDGYRIHDHSVRASEDSSCLRLLGYCDRQYN